MRKKLYCNEEYEVDSDGYIVSKRYGTPLKASKNSGGYLICDVYNGNGRGVSVAVAVARAFVDGYEPGLQVNHKDGNKENNQFTNLEWVTRSENMRHSIDILGEHIGANNPNSKCIIALTPTGERFAEYKSIADAARDFVRDGNNYNYIKTSIWRALQGRRKTYHKLVWKYA